MVGRLFGFLRQFLKAPQQPPCGSYYFAHENRDRKQIYHLDDCEFGRKICRPWLVSCQGDADAEGYRSCMVSLPDWRPYRNDEWVPDIWRDCG